LGFAEINGDLAHFGAVEQLLAAWWAVLDLRRRGCVAAEVVVEGAGAIADEAADEQDGTENDGHLKEQVGVLHCDDSRIGDVPLNRARGTTVPDPDVSTRR
jgi:hypothetical protein